MGGGRWAKDRGVGGDSKRGGSVILIRDVRSCLGIINRRSTKVNKMDFSLWGMESTRV